MTLKQIVAEALQRKNDREQKNKGILPTNPVAEPVLKKLAAIQKSGQGKSLSYSSIQHVIFEQTGKQTVEQTLNDIGKLIESGILLPILWIAESSDDSDIPDEFCLTKDDENFTSLQGVLTGTEQAIHPNSGNPVPYENLYLSFEIAPH